MIYGGLTRKDLFNCRVKDLTAVAPYETEEQKAEADGFAADRRLVMVSGTDEQDGGDKQIWYAIYAPEDGEKTVLVFDTEEKLRKLMKYYGGSSVHI